MIHLDTCDLIRSLVPGSKEDAELRKWIRAGEVLAISTAAWAEFLCGPVEPEEADLAARVVKQRLPFGSDAAQLAATLFNAGGRRRGSLLDCMIAAVAILAGARFATRNKTDFRRFEEHGLRMV